MSNEKVEIFYRNSSLKLNFEKITDANLRRFFKLTFTPESLHPLDAAGNTGSRFIPFELIPDDLEPGGKYRIKDINEDSEPSNDETPLGQEERPKREPRDVLEDAAPTAALLSKAVYKDSIEECGYFLNEEGQDLNVDSFAFGRHGTHVFLIGISKQTKAVYVSFRGSKNESDWLVNFDAKLSKSVLCQGDFHSGFLQRANSFPFSVLDAHLEPDWDVVFCGHSTGGSIASIAAIHLHESFAKDNNHNNDVFCITFGSPFFAGLTLQECCGKSGMASKMLHYVNEGDPVPLCLSYTIWLKAVKDNLPGIPASANIDIGTVNKVVGSCLTALKFILDVTNSPASGPVTILRDMFNIMSEKTDSSPFVHMGNIVMLKECGDDHLKIHSSLGSEVKKAWITSMEVLLKDVNNDFNTYKTNHKMDKYRSLIKSKAEKTGGKRMIDGINVNYIPEIVDAKMFITPSQIIIELFGQNVELLVADGIKIQHLGFSDSKQRVDVKPQKLTLLYERAENNHEHFRDLKSKCIKFTLTNPFGITDEFLIEHKVDVDSVEEEETMFHLLMKAIQRIRIKKAIGMNPGETCNHILHLAELAQGGSGDGSGSNPLKTVLNRQSNTGKLEYREEDEEMTQQIVKDIVTKVLFPEKSGSNSLSASLLVVAAVIVTAPVAILLAPLLFGVSWIPWAFLQQLKTNYEHNLRIKINVYRSNILKYSQSEEEKIEVIEQYKEVCQMNLKQLEKTCLGFGEKLQTVYQRSGYKVGFFTMLWDKCSPASLAQDLIVLRAVHGIRTITDNECFVGITGFQNSGKSTLIKKLLGPDRVSELKEKTGAMVHTKEVHSYPYYKDEVERLNLLDFPGSNSINKNHAELFGHLGSVNNLTVIVIRYDGNLNEHIINEVVTVLCTVMASPTAKMMLCFNKCLPDIVDHINEDPNLDLDGIKYRFAKEIEKAYEKMKKGLMSRIIEHTRKTVGKDPIFKSVNIDALKNNIHFTDWFLNDPNYKSIPKEYIEKAKELGVVSFDRVKQEIEEFESKMKARVAAEM